MKVVDIYVFIIINASFIKSYLSLFPLCAYLFVHVNI